MCPCTPGSPLILPDLKQACHLAPGALQEAPACLQIRQRDISMRIFALLKAGFSPSRCSSLNLSAPVTPPGREDLPTDVHIQSGSSSTVVWEQVKHHIRVRDSPKSFIFILRISFCGCCCCWCNLRALGGCLRSRAMWPCAEVPVFSFSLHGVKTKQNKMKHCI